ncbi:xanthine dehydrogenase family protein molybdopterin-binding subunit [Hydrogenophaga sp. BPS33]|uniref:xanthine dehydrogenase family protein molybdopterin-binding subunit n=1 Tax=Hydrogenophaga sp. BPS33 TaxID=2651974 RepID=UPI00131FFB73|nr:xanthine dehydrogenase family protein molybdopterin-binding subunit [Hydrogenophaga sp. BPS33]QHE83912.1 xanthine dehydrogenase family protein molybdopterin-binding subunit [Hydrogenophaga sp. BPS33]
MSDTMIGRAVERSEDTRLLTGRGRYVDDVKRPGMLHAVVVRSPMAHATVLSIDASAALELPGVVKVITYADIAALAKAIPQRTCPLPGMENFLQMPMADQVVRYVGEPVAMVIAENRYIAEDAAELVYVDYDGLDAVVDARDAAQNKVVVHAAQGTNVASAYRVGRGDIEAAFRNAHYTRKESFYVHRHSAVPLETRGLVAEWDANAQHMSVWGAGKVPFANRGILADMLGLPNTQVDMIEVDVGGSFGVRGDFYPEDFLVPFAAQQIGRPVKWIEDRRENLMAMNHSREMHCELEIAVDRDGRIQGMRGKVMGDIGAYVRTNPGVMAGKGTQFMQGAYAIPNLDFDVCAIITNKTPAGTYRGPGRYESCFFRERLMDIVAGEMGIDPIEFRRKNLIRADQMPYDAGALVPGQGTTIYDSGNYPEVFERGLAHFSYAELAQRNGQLIDGKLHGVGLACFTESTGGGPGEHARIELRQDGSFDLFVGSSSAGQGHETSMAQVLADSLNVPFASIRVHHGSTTYLKQGFGAYHSRSAVMGGSAVHKAGQDMVRTLLARAASLKGLPDAQGLAWRDGQVMRESDGGVVATLAELSAGLPDCGHEAHGPVSVETSFMNDKLTFTFGLQLAHVSVDPKTAQVKVEKFLCVEDVGRMINPLIVHGQTIGAAVQGMGGTFLDEFIYDEDGQLTTGTFADYLLPVSTDFEHVDALTLELSPSPSNPLGVKGAGEGGIIGTGGALANAVCNALSGLSVSVTRLPMSLDRLAATMREARAAKGLA